MYGSLLRFLPLFTKKSAEIFSLLPDHGLCHALWEVKNRGQHKLLCACCNLSVAVMFIYSWTCKQIIWLYSQYRCSYHATSCAMLSALWTIILTVLFMYYPFFIIFTSYSLWYQILILARSIWFYYNYSNCYFVQYPFH